VLIIGEPGDTRRGSLGECESEPPPPVDCDCMRTVGPASRAADAPAPAARTAS
jgi:hypothetical protein